VRRRKIVVWRLNLWRNGATASATNVAIGAPRIKSGGDASAAAAWRHQMRVMVKRGSSVRRNGAWRASRCVASVARHRMLRKYLLVTSNGGAEII